MDSLGERLNVIQRRLGALPLRDLERPGPIDDFKSDLIEAGKANATVNRYLAQLRHMINWAIGRELMRRSPFYHRMLNSNGVKLLKGENSRARRVYPDEEARLLVAADSLNTAKHEFVGPVMRARIEMAVDKGVRRGEMLKIKNRDIDWKATPDPILTIQWGNSQNRRKREIPLVSPRVLRWLHSRRAVGGLDGHPFGDLDGSYLKSFRTAWEAVLAKAGIKDPKRNLDQDLHWHDLKHECGSRYAEQGMDVRRIQYLLGHADLRTTERYLNPNVRMLGDAMRKVMKW